jgi:hypothetical protein
MKTKRDNLEERRRMSESMEIQFLIKLDNLLYLDCKNIFYYCTEVEEVELAECNEFEAFWNKNICAMPPVACANCEFPGCDITVI